MADVTVDTGTSYQTWKGWEATCQAAHQYKVGPDTYEYPSTTFPNYDDNLFAAMLDLGINRLRLEMKFSDVNVTGYKDSGTPNPAVQPSTAAEGDWRHERWVSAMDAVVMPYRTLLAAQGEQLWVSFCLVDFDDAGYDAENTPSEYSFFVKKVMTKFWTDYGFLPNSIEAILEPDNGENLTNWTATKIANNIVQAQADLAADGTLGPAGAGNIKWIAPTTTNGPAATTWYTNMKTANASVTALMDQVSYHLYVNMDASQRNTLRTNAEGDGNSPMMGELIAATHLTCYEDLIEARVNAWQQYTLAFPYTGWTETGSEYFEVNQSTWVVTMNPRTKYLRSYFKYIRLNAVMKGVTNSDANFKGVPFLNANGTYVVPIKCLASGTINVKSLPAGTYGIRYTTGDGTAAPSAFDTALANQTITAGQDVSFSMPAAGVVTVFDINFMQQSSGSAQSLMTLLL